MSEGTDKVQIVADRINSRLALTLIGRERKRQIAKGYTAAHDDEHTLRELVQAALAYAAAAVGFGDYDEWWPWEPETFKPEALDPRPDLVRAGALLVAAIEHINRANARQREDQ